MSALETAYDQKVAECKKLSAEVSRLTAELAAVRAGDTCGRQCEGTAYRITARSLQLEVDRLSALASQWNAECDEMREDNKRLAAELAEAVERENNAKCLRCGSRLFEVTDRPAPAAQTPVAGLFRTQSNKIECFYRGSLCPIDGNHFPQEFVDALPLGRTVPLYLHPVPAAQAVPEEWRDVAIHGLPHDAQEVLFVRSGKTVHGAFIGGLFWHSNKQCAAAEWMPLPRPPTNKTRLTAPQPPADQVPAATPSEQKTRLIGICQNCGHEHDMGVRETLLDAHAAQVAREHDDGSALLYAVERCYAALIAEPNTATEQLKAEDILREAIADAKRSRS